MIEKLLIRLEPKKLSWVDAIYAIALAAIIFASIDDLNGLPPQGNEKAAYLFPPWAVWPARVCAGYFLLSALYWDTRLWVESGDWKNNRLGWFREREEERPEEGDFGREHS